ncbi:MAG: hypothetical protein AABZ08_06645 [Planctomycetota bacterium]
MAINFNEVFAAFGYTLSLPERLARSLAATLGGATKILTDTLIPEPLRKTNTFTAVVGNAQRFFIEKVAEVQGAYGDTPGATLPDDYVQRAIAGNLINTVGILSVHLSPLWVFALASDVSHGSKVYLNRLVTELKENKVIPQDANISEVTELLDSLGKAGKETAQVFDIPPVDVGQLRELRDRLTSGYQNVFREATDLLPRMDTLWKKIESLASRDNVAIESIVGLMTVDLAKGAGKAVDAAFVVGNVTTNVVAETILQSYGETILRVQNRGALACLDEATRPYMDAISTHMSLEKETWTEWALKKVLSPIASKAAKPTPDPASPESPPDGSMN